MSGNWPDPARQRVAEALCMNFYGTGWGDTSEFRRGICDNMAVAALTALGPCLTPAEVAAREAAAYQRGQRDMQEAAAKAASEVQPLEDGEFFVIDRAVEFIRALPIKETPDE